MIKEHADEASVPKNVGAKTKGLICVLVGLCHLEKLFSEEAPVDEQRVFVSQVQGRLTSEYVRTE